jgi:hypothetical protein
MTAVRQLDSVNRTHIRTGIEHANLAERLNGEALGSSGTNGCWP